ncbi:MAG: GNAT family N-acetyltransferase [Spirochaetaceae bacterium]|nr:GNAT family N-acetyltransferase [Spirochaetaceae bacterium]
MNYIIETERLKLRELTLDDTEKLALVLSDPQSMRFYPHPFSREEVEHWIKWNIENYKKYGFGLWAVIEKESGEFIGDCGITMQQVDLGFIQNPKNGRVKALSEACLDRPYEDLFHEIGYHLRKEYRGKGYATEAARACSEFAKSKGVKQIISYMKSDNLPSRHVAERNGMTFVKSFTKTVMGKVVEDEVLYMKTL